MSSIFVATVEFLIDFLSALKMSNIKPKRKPTKTYIKKENKMKFARKIERKREIEKAKEIHRTYEKNQNRNVLIAIKKGKIL